MLLQPYCFNNTAYIITPLGSQLTQLPPICLRDPSTNTSTILVVYHKYNQIRAEKHVGLGGVIAGWFIRSAAGCLRAHPRPNSCFLLQHHTHNPFVFTA